MLATAFGFLPTFHKPPSLVGVGFFCIFPLPSYLSIGTMKMGDGTCRSSSFCILKGGAESRFVTCYLSIRYTVYRTSTERKLKATQTFRHLCPNRISINQASVKPAASGAPRPACIRKRRASRALHRSSPSPVDPPPRDWAVA